MLLRSLSHSDQIHPGHSRVHSFPPFHRRFLRTMGWLSFGEQGNPPCPFIPSPSPFCSSRAEPFLCRLLSTVTMLFMQPSQRCFQNALDFITPLSAYIPDISPHQALNKRQLLLLRCTLSTSASLSSILTTPYVSRYPRDALRFVSWIC